MNKIDEKKLLEFCGIKYIGMNCHAGMPQKVYLLPDGEEDADINIYSLDWQKEYLWPKIPFFKFYNRDNEYSIFIEADPRLEIRGKFNVLKPCPYFGEDKDPATAILKAVMSLIGEENA